MAHFGYPIHQPAWQHTVSDRTVPVQDGTGRVTDSGSTPAPQDWGQQAVIKAVDYGEPLSISSTGTAWTDPFATRQQMETLISLLRLTDEERAFVRRGLADPSRDFFLVLADWLEEQGRDAASARFRAMGEGRAA